jgi:hypothetical protein
MTKIVISDSAGISQSAGSGTRIDSNISGLATAQIKNAFYSNPETIRAAASPAQLDSRPVQFVDSTDDGHFVKMPLAAGAGQLMIIVNVDSSQEMIVRNNADDTSLATLVEGKIGIFVSSATGDNWAGSQVD